MRGRSALSFAPMRPIAIVGFLCVATGGAAVASACSSFNEAETGSADAATSEAAAIDAASADSAVPDAQVFVDAAACVLATSPTLVAATTSVATKLGTNGESLFWIEGGTRIVRASIADCSTTEVAKGNINALAVDPQWVVWGDDMYRSLARNDVGTGVTPHMYNTPISPSLILARGTALWLDPANGNVSACETPCVGTSVAAQVASPMLLAANASRFFLFGVDADGGTAGALFWHALTGGELFGPITKNADPLFLAANDQQVFWVSSNGSVTGLPSGGGKAIAFANVSGVQALAVDSSYVYVATATQIQRAPVSGVGAWKPVVTGETAIKSLLVTPDAVVWGTSVAVRRIMKPVP